MVVSEPERLILDALVISPDLPKIQDRAEIILKASHGLGDEQIAAALRIRRKDVLHWRNRFQEHGIRGLWDEHGLGTGRHMTREKEQAILWDLLYDMWGLAGILNLNNKLLAQTHHVSRHAVNRICAKHGIVRDKFSRVDIDRLKIFRDPLFGVTVSRIAGLFSSTVGVLALRSSDKPFSKLVFWTRSPVEQIIDPFLAELRELAQSREFWPMLANQRQDIDQKFLLDWLNEIELTLTPEEEVHLFVTTPTTPVQDATPFREWLAAHPKFRAYYAPKKVRMSWFKFVFRCFAIIAKLPVQAELITDIKRLTARITGYAKEHRLEPFGFVQT